MGKSVGFPLSLRLVCMSTNPVLSPIHHTHQRLENRFNETAATGAITTGCPLLLFCEVPAMQTGSSVGSCSRAVDSQDPHMILFKDSVIQKGKMEILGEEEMGVVKKKREPTLCPADAGLLTLSVDTVIITRIMCRSLCSKARNGQYPYDRNGKQW